MSKAIVSLIKPLHQPRRKPSKKIFVPPHCKKFAYEVCEILRTQEIQWEETLKDRFFVEDIAPSEIAHLVFDKIRDFELGLKFFDFASRNSHSLDGFAYSSLLKLLARSKVFIEVDKVLIECMHSEERLPTCESIDFVIRAYVESGMFSKALELFSFMLKMYDALPNLLTCHSLLNDLVKDGNMEAAWGVYNEMEKRDDGYLDNYSICIMVKGLCKEEKVEEGKRLIEKRLGKNCIPNIVFYNTLIDGYCKRGNIKKACGLFDDLKMKGFLPNQETYGTLINGFCKRGEFDKVDEILMEMDSIGIEINTLMYNNIVDAKCKFGLVGEALETVRKMIQVGRELDIVTYNTLISNACRVGKVREAEKLLEEVMNSGLLPNKLTFTPLILYYCREGNFDRASNLLIKMTEYGHKPDLITYGGLIHGLVAFKDVDAALTIRNKMMEKSVSPDACIYNILINGLFKKGRFADAKKLVVEMLDQNVSLDGYIYATLIDGYVRNCDFNSAKKLFDDLISRGVNLRISAYNAMIKGYCKVGALKDAILCFKKMAQRDDIYPDEFTYSTIMGGFAKQNDLTGALSVFCHVIKRIQVPNIVTYTALLDGFCHNGDIAGAKKILNDMKLNRVAPNTVTYTILIGACCKKGNIGNASSFFDEMLTNKCNPNDITFHHLVNGLSVPRLKSGDDADNSSSNNKHMLLDIFGTMISEGFHPISAAYTSIISCLCLKGMLDTSLQLVDKTLKKGLPPDSVTLAALLHGICSSGKSKEWRNMICSKVFDLKPDIALKFLSIFEEYSSREVMREALMILHTLVKEQKSDECNGHGS